MTEVMTRPDQAAPASAAKVAVATSRRRWMDVGGPLAAAALMAAGGCLLAGWAIVSGATGGAFASQADPGGQLAVVSPAPTDQDPRGREQTEGMVTLPDTDGDGIPDEYEGVKPDGLEPIEPVEPEPEPTPALELYLIRQGDTLADVSALTGVPIDMLMEANHIADPNLIYAGAVLVIPQV